MWREIEAHLDASAALACVGRATHPACRPSPCSLAAGLGREGEEGDHYLVPMVLVALVRRPRARGEGI